MASAARKSASSSRTAPPSPRALWLGAAPGRQEDSPVGHHHIRADDQRHHSATQHQHAAQDHDHGPGQRQQAASSSRTARTSAPTPLPRTDRESLERVGEVIRSAHAPDSRPTSPAVPRRPRPPQRGGGLMTVPRPGPAAADRQQGSPSGRLTGTREAGPSLRGPTLAAVSRQRAWPAFWPTAAPSAAPRQLLPVAKFSRTTAPATVHTYTTRRQIPQGGLVRLPAAPSIVPIIAHRLPPPRPASSSGPAQIIHARESTRTPPQRSQHRPGVPASRTAGHRHVLPPACLRCRQ